MPVLVGRFVVATITLVVASVPTTLPQQQTAGPELLDELVRAEAKWQASKTEGYEFRFQHACNGLIPLPPPDLRPGLLIRVKGGDSTYLPPGAAPVPVAAELVQYSTVEKLFAAIRKAWSSHPAHMEVQYDQARGYPIRACVDPAASVSDDEFGFLIAEFRVLSNAGLPDAEMTSGKYNELLAFAGFPRVK